MNDLNCTFGSTRSEVNYSSGAFKDHVNEAAKEVVISGQRFAQHDYIMDYFANNPVPHMYFARKKREPSLETEAEENDVSKTTWWTVVGRVTSIKRLRDRVDENNLARFHFFYEEIEHSGKRRSNKDKLAELLCPGKVILNERRNGSVLEYTAVLGDDLADKDSVFEEMRK